MSYSFRHLKSLLLLIAWFLLTTAVHAQTKYFTDQGSTVQFSIKNFGLKTNGSFSGIKGSLTFDFTDLSKSSVTISVNTNSINTDNSSRDNHLRKEDYFHVEKYPTMDFLSTKIIKGKTSNTYTISGNLRIKGITKFIQFEIRTTEQANGQLYMGEFELNRRDFGVGKSSISLSDQVLIKFNILIL